MNVYSLPPPPETGAVLERLAAGIVRVGILPSHSAHIGCSWCVFETADGSVIHVFPAQQDLQFKFEVFPLGISADAPRMDRVVWAPLTFSAPVTAMLQETEEWLDPKVSCDGALGQDPIVQCQGVPGSAPKSAIAVCRYTGGIELIGANGRTVFIATASFPYTLHLGGVAEDERVSRENYRNAA